MLFLLLFTLQRKFFTNSVFDIFFNVIYFPFSHGSRPPPNPLLAHIPSQMLLPPTPQDPAILFFLFDSFFQLSVALSNIL